MLWSLLSVARAFRAMRILACQRKSLSVSLNSLKGLSVSEKAQGVSELTVIVRWKHGLVLGGSKVTDFNPHIRIQQDILGFEITVDYVHPVNERDGIQDSGCVVLRPLDIK